MKTLLAKSVKTLFAAAAIIFALSSKSDAATFVNGGYKIDDSTVLDLNREYVTSGLKESVAYWFAFDTNGQEGFYVIHAQSAIKGGQGSACVAYSNTYISLTDQYKTTIKSFTNSRDYNDRKYVRERGETYWGDVAFVHNNIIYSNELSPNKEYFIKLTVEDGVEGWDFPKSAQIYVEFIPFKNPSGFSMNVLDNGNLRFSWNNIQPYNTYSSLFDYEQFSIMFTGPSSESGTGRLVGNGDTKSYTFEPDYFALKCFGYPFETVYATLVSSYNINFHYDEAYSSRIDSWGDRITLPVIKQNATYDIKGISYKVTKAQNYGNGTVTVTGLSKSNKNAKKVSIPKTVKIYGVDFKVTDISKKAFYGQKKLTDVTIGANVVKIGQSAFQNCKKLKKVDIKSTELKSVGKNAFAKMSKKGTIKVPSKKKKLYNRLLKGKYTKGVVVK